MTSVQPLNAAQLGVIRIVKAALQGTGERLPDGFDPAEAEAIVREHHIVGLAYEGLRNMGEPCPEWLQSLYLQEVSFLTRLWNAAGQVMKAFDEAGIEYRPLKGFRTKDRYPNRYMRHMSDVDILIHEEDYAGRIRPLMRSLGWTEEEKATHQYGWSRNGYEVELHHRLVPTNSEDFTAVIGDSWTWLAGHSGFAFDLMHFTRHYRSTGIGIAHLAEMEVCWEDIDFAELGLAEFAANVRRTLDVWFHGGAEDEVTRLISSVVFSSGEYGREESNREYRQLKVLAESGGDVRKADRTRKLRLLFPSWESWKYRNPILKKLPFLLPYFWVLRAAEAALDGSKRRQYAEKVSAHDDRYEQLKAVGLEFKE